MTPVARSSVALLVIVLAGCAAVSPPGEESALGGNEAPEQLRYGAIAFSQSTQVWRIRWNVTDPDRAGALALSNCGQSDCRTILTFGPGQCGTFSLGDGGALGVGAGPTKESAESTALARCQGSGEACKVAPTQCNT